MTRTTITLCTALVMAACAESHPVQTDPACSEPSGYVPSVPEPLTWTPCTLLSNCGEYHEGAPWRPMAGQPCGPEWVSEAEAQCFDGAAGWAHGPVYRATTTTSGACSGPEVQVSYAEWRCADRAPCDPEAPCSPDAIERP